MDPTSSAAPPPPEPAKSDRLNPALQQQLNLDAVKARADGLYKAVSRIINDFEVFARSNATPKWEDVLGQYSMVNMELYNITEEIKKVSKAFVIHPKFVNQKSAEILPVMLSSKLLPEMEAEDNAKREQLLNGITNLPITTQIEKLKARIDMIGAACDTAEKIITDARKTYGLGSRQGPTILPSLDKAQAAKIQEQENILRAAINSGEGLRIPVDQRHVPTSLPSHLVDLLTASDGPQNFTETSGAFAKNPASFSSNNVNTQGAIVQPPGGQSMGRPVPSPSGATSFDNAATPPLPYANSPRSGTNIMNAPSPQQQAQQQQQRQKLMQQMPQHQQQLIAQQQMRQNSTAGVLGQNSLSQLHDFQGQAQQKFQQMPGQQHMQFSQPLGQQQFQNRQMQSAHMLTQSQMNQGNQMRNHHLNQFSGSANSALFNAAQTSPNPQMITNLSATMQSQSVPRLPYLSSGHPQRAHPSQIVNDQMFAMGATNPASMVSMQQQQQQQHGTQGGYGNMQMNTQNLQQGMGTLPNTAQNPNFQQQRQQNQ